MIYEFLPGTKVGSSCNCSFSSPLQEAVVAVSMFGTLMKSQSSTLTTLLATTASDEVVLVFFFVASLCPPLKFEVVSFSTMAVSLTYLLCGVIFSQLLTQSKLVSPCIISSSSALTAASSSVLTVDIVKWLDQLLVLQFAREK